MPIIPCYPVELHEGKLNLLVSANPVFVRDAKGGIDMIGQADGDIQEFSFSGRIEVGNGGFHQMAGAIVFVHGNTRPPLVQSGERVVGVQVSVRLLCGSDFVDPFVGFLSQRGVGVRA